MLQELAYAGFLLLGMVVASLIIWARFVIPLEGELHLANRLLDLEKQFRKDDESRHKQEVDFEKGLRKLYEKYVYGQALPEDPEAHEEQAN